MAPWADLTRDEFFEIASLRCEVFYVEQRIDVQDFDEADRDPTTLHHWISDDRGCAAYLRFITLPKKELDAAHSFGRVAVRRDRRGEGLARQLVARVLTEHGHLPMTLHSQEYVAGLYAEFGFDVVGERYEEAGLPHLMMFRPGAVPA